MSGDWAQVVQDILVVLFLFALRIGVPLLVMFALGAWLKKVLEPQTRSSLQETKPPRPWQGGLGRHVRLIALWLRELSEKRT